MDIVVSTIQASQHQSKSNQGNQDFNGNQKNVIQEQQSDTCLNDTK